jgi:hypothetical protein
VRQALLRYLDTDLSRVHHRALVKRLFKLAEQAGDDEAMAHFLAAFDRFSLRRLVKHGRWDAKTRRWVQEMRLAHRRDLPDRPPFDSELSLFSRRTRGYLQRRAFRYFRRLALRDPARFRRAMVVALPLYRDEHLRTPAQLLDAWGLCHVLFGRSPVLTRVPGGVRLSPEQSLKDLAPAAMFDDAWWEGFEELLVIFERATSRTVRGWSEAMLRRHHGERLAGLPLSRLLPLLRSSEPEVQSLGLELLRSATGLGELPLADWLALLEVPGPQVLPVVCELVRVHVSPARLSLAQCVDLACAGAAPVAELGLSWTKARPVGSDDLATLARLAGARTKRIRSEAMEWLGPLLDERADTPVELVRELLDGLHPEARAKGLWLMQRDRFQDQTSLWLALAESPWDDVRAVLARHLEERARLLPDGTVRHLCATVLLGVHRGGREKRRVVAELARRITRAPSETGSLLPLLAVTLRSIRAPERRAALAALAQAAFRQPKLRAALAEALPELRLFDEVPA